MTPIRVHSMSAESDVTYHKGSPLICANLSILLRVSINHKWTDDRWGEVQMDISRLGTAIRWIANKTKIRQVAPIIKLFSQVITRWQRTTERWAARSQSIDHHLQTHITRFRRPIFSGEWLNIKGNWVGVYLKTKTLFPLSIKLSNKPTICRKASVWFRILLSSHNMQRQRSQLCNFRDIAI